MSFASYFGALPSATLSTGHSVITELSSFSGEFFASFKDPGELLFRSVRLLDKGFSLPSFFSVSIQVHFSTGSSNAPNGIMNTGLGSFELFSLELPFSVLLFLCFPSVFPRTGSFTNGSALAVTTVELL